jgi:predicted kinase
VGRLMLINGAPGSGKSTLARRYIQDHPLTLALDVDQVRGMLGRWLDTPTEAGLLARHMAIEMARVHLGAGHDVVVPQFLGRLDYIVTLQRMCEQVNAEFVEVVLLSSPDEAATRFARRSDQSTIAEHQDAAALVERSGGPDVLRDIYRRLLAVVAARPATRTVVTVDGEVDQAYADLLRVVRR